MTTNVRQYGIQALACVMDKECNIKIVEKYTHFASMKHDAYEDVYRDQIYENVCYLMEHTSSKKAISELVRNLYKNGLFWNHDLYGEYVRVHAQQEEEDVFLTNPLEVEEGVIECVCGSKYTISYQRQTRSADEGSTTYVECVECGKKWRFNN